MRQTVVLCDLHDGSADASRSVQVHVGEDVRRLDVCSDHAAWLLGLPAPDPDQGERPDEHPGVSRPPTRIRTASGGRAPHGATTKVLTGAGVRAGSRRSLRAERAAARDWARTQGRDVADRGRLPTGLLELYRAETG